MDILVSGGSFRLSDSENDYESLLYLLSKIKGKFLLSSYPSPLLEKHIKEFKWHKWSVNQKVSVNTRAGNPKIKTEMLVANYQFPLAHEVITQLF